MKRVYAGRDYPMDAPVPNWMLARPHFSPKRPGIVRCKTHQVYSEVRGMRQVAGFFFKHRMSDGCKGVKAEFKPYRSKPKRKR